MHLSREAFEALLRTDRVGRAPGWANEIWESIDSTNARALALAAEGAPHGLVVAARQQSAGRGRRGRTWISPADTGLYISFILRPNTPPTALPLISLAAGCATARCLQRSCGFNPKLKWVNDIVHHGKKIGGILCEMQHGTNNPAAVPRALIVGIGLNLRLNPDDMPDEIKDTAESIEHIIGSPVDTNVIAAELCLQIERSYETLCTLGDRLKILQDWKADSATIGQDIYASSSGGQLEGRAVDLAPDGGLIVELTDGSRITLHAGEVTIRKQDGRYA